MSLLIDKFYNSAKKYSDKTALVCGDSSLSYNELLLRVNQTSNLFVKNGIKSGEKIGVMVDNSIETIVLMLVSANIGAVFVPIDCTSPINIVKNYIQKLEIKHFVCNHNFIQLNLNIIDDLLISGKIVCTDFEFPNLISLLNAKYESLDKEFASEINDDTDFLYSLTSGSTGNPKSLVLSHRVKYRRSMEHIKFYNIDSNDVILASTPLYHTLSQRLILMSLLVGAKGVIMHEFFSHEWVNLVKRNNVTFTISIPNQLSKIAELIYSPFLPDIKSLRLIVSSSAILDLHVKRELLQKFDCEIHEIYGTSETATITDVKITKGNLTDFIVGKPLPNVKVKIIDKYNNEVAINQLGEIICKTLMIFDGYVPNDLSNVKLFIGDYFRTGDIGYIDDSGNLNFINRMYDVIKSNGINVYPRDVESCIAKFKGVLDSVCFSYPDIVTEDSVGIALVIDKNIKVEASAVLEYFKTNLINYQIPKVISFVDEIPKNSLGIVLKEKLIEKVRKNLNRKSNKD